MGKIALLSKFCFLQCVSFNFDLIYFFVSFSLFLLSRVHKLSANDLWPSENQNIPSDSVISVLQAEFAKFHYLCFFFLFYKESLPVYIVASDTTSHFLGFDNINFELRNN